MSPSAGNSGLGFSLHAFGVDLRGKAHFYAADFDDCRCSLPLLWDSSENASGAFSEGD